MHNGIFMGELTKQKILKDKERERQRVKGALMVQFNSDLADVVANPSDTNK